MKSGVFGRIVMWYGLLQCIAVFGEVSGTSGGSKFLPDEIYYDTVKSRVVAMLSGGTGRGAYRLAAVRNNDTRCAAYLNNALWDFDTTTVDRSRDGEVISKVLLRIHELCIAYNASGGEWFRDERVYKRIQDELNIVLEYYETNTSHPRPGNWYQWIITNPNHLGAIGLLMESHLTDRMLKRVKSVITDSIGEDLLLTGANAAWEARNHIYLALLTKDFDRLKKSADHVFADVRYTTDSGVREDYSYLFHGRIPYAGGYGAGFAQTVSQFMYLFYGTSWGASDEKRELIANLLLEHTSWFIEGDRYDLHISGRGYEKAQSAGTIFEAILTMAQIETSRQQEMMAAAVTLMSADVPVGLAVADFADVVAISKKRLQRKGFRYWYSSETGVYKGKGFHVGFRQFSNRVQDYEYLTGEGIDGWNLAMGFTNILCSDGRGDWYQDDGMLDDIDMDHLPGVTGRVDAHPQNPVGDYSETGFSLNFGTSVFAGGAGSEGGGVSGFILEPVYGDFTAKKSLHFFPEGFWALGSAINSEGNSGADSGVHTTVLQWVCYEDSTPSLHTDSGDRIVTENAAMLEGVSWIWIDGVGVVFREAATIWTRRKGLVVTIWLDHGVYPVDEKYAYAVLPDIPVDGAKAFAESFPVLPVRHNEEIHAVLDTRNGSAGCVFFEAGSCTDIEVSSPAIVYRDQTQKGSVFSLQNPLHDERLVQLRAKKNGLIHIADAEVVVTETDDSTHTLQISSASGRIYRFGIGEAGKSVTPVPRRDLHEFRTFQVEATSDPEKTVFTVQFPEGVLDSDYQLLLQGYQGHALLHLENGIPLAPNVLQYSWDRKPAINAQGNTPLQQVAGDFRISLLTELMMATDYISIPFFNEDGVIVADKKYPRDRNRPQHP